MQGGFFVFLIYIKRPLWVKEIRLNAEIEINSKILTRASAG